PAPKGKKRQWLWMLVGGFTIIGFGGWLVMPSNKIEQGDAGYRRMVQYGNRCQVLERIEGALPGPLRRPIYALALKTEARFGRQADRLCAEGYLGYMTIQITNAPFPLTNVLQPSSTDELSAMIHAAAPDKSCPPFIYVTGLSPNSIVSTLLCRAKDVPQ